MCTKVLSWSVAWEGGGVSMGVAASQGGGLDVGFADGGHFVQSMTPAIARIIMIPKTTCSTANRTGIHCSMVVTAR